VEWLVRDSNDQQHWLEVHPRVVSVLGGLGATLECLTLAYVTLTDKVIRDCLTRLPGLVHLDLRFSLADRHYDPITNDFLDACIIPPGRSHFSFLPLLESMTLQCHGAHCSISLLVDLIHSRWSPGQCNGARSSLKAFSFISMKPVGNDARQRLRHWKEAGLNVTLDSISMA